MSDIVTLLGTYAAGAASGAGAMYLWAARTKSLVRPIPSNWVPRQLPPDVQELAHKYINSQTRSPYAPKARQRSWLTAKAADAALDALEPSRSKIEPTSPRLPSIGWGKPDAK